MIEIRIQGKNETVSVRSSGYESGLEWSVTILDVRNNELVIRDRACLEGLAAALGIVIKDLF
jgi:hypothetical protein